MTDMPCCLLQRCFSFYNSKKKEEKEEKREKRKQRENHNVMNAMAGDRTRIDCLEGNHADRTCGNLLPVSFLSSVISSFSQVIAC